MNYKDKNTAKRNMSSSVCASSLHANVVFSVCACMGNATNIKFIMWSSISGLDARLTKVVSYD